MAVWSGLGVNYKGTTATMAVDADYFSSIGLNKIRVHIPSVGDTSWREVAAYFHGRGFHVLYGLNRSGGLTAANWSAYSDAVIAEAAYCEANDVCSEFTIGNELHYGIDGTTLVASTLRSNLRTLCNSVKAVFSGIVAYDTDVNDYTGWISEGIGNLDRFNYHCYSNWISAGKYILETNMRTPIPLLVAAFPTTLQVTEFNLDSDAADLTAMSADMRVSYFRTMYKFLKDQGVTSAYVFSFCGYQYLNNDFAMKNLNGTFNDQWDVLLTNNGRRSFVN